MAVEQAAGPAKGRTLVRNIGLLLSGDLARRCWMPMPS